MSLSRSAVILISVVLAGGLCRGWLQSGGQTPGQQTALPSEPLFRLDLNQADAIECSLLPDVGPVLARRIVEHRRTHGPFTAPRDLLNVHGIGEKRLAKIEPYLEIGGTAVTDLTAAGWAADR